MIRLGILFLLVLAANGAEGQSGMRHGRGMRHGAAHESMLRHHYVAQHGLEAQYAGKSRPRQPTAEDLASGQTLFARHCASCHGERGAGDGEAGAGLNPPPADVAFAARRPIASDGYLFWTIAEGGVPIGSAMPPFKDVLDDDEVWQIIAHLREL
ncbi:MAG: cytochrome c [Lysobacterales bacterium]|nr:MAG: cytochrome c [Xanthomonadales bacterium]